MVLLIIDTNKWAIILSEVKKKKLWVEYTGNFLGVEKLNRA